MEQKPNKSTPAGVRKDNAFRHPDAQAMVLDMAMLQRYGPDWLTWESETIEIRLQKDLGYALSSINLSKLEAMRAMHMVDSFWERWEVFVWCTMPINGIYPDFEVMQVPNVFQCMAAVHTASRIRTDVQWSGEVSTYLSLVHRHDEVLVPQSPLDFVTLDMSEFPIDIPEVKERWVSVRKNRKAPTEDTAEAEQLRRMLELYQFFQESRLELREQLKVVLRA